MRYDNSSAFEKYLAGTAPGPFNPLYLILGKEVFECREAVRLLLGFLVPSPKEQELALTIFEGPQVEENHLWTSLNSRSFLVESQVIWIQQADKLKKNIQEKLEVFFPRRIPSLYLILSASGWQKIPLFLKQSIKMALFLNSLSLSLGKRKSVSRNGSINKRLPNEADLLSSVPIPG